jgi:hypothetical protein
MTKRLLTSCKMQNLSRVPTFNVLDPGVKRSDTSLHVPEEADQDAESEQETIASPKLRQSRGLGWRIHESVEDTKLSTNKQHTLER